MLPSSIQRFIAAFSKLPSLGPRASTRLAFYLTNLDRQSFDVIKNAFSDLKTINKCKNCFFIKETSEALCAICSNPNRNKKIIAIIEKETDLLSIEKPGAFKGTYFIIGELNDKDIISSNQKLRLQYLKTRIKNEIASKAEEIIVALNPNAISDVLYEMVKDEFKNLAAKITRLGRGIPTGGEIEFADEETLSQALERRI